MPEFGSIYAPSPKTKNATAFKIAAKKAFFEPEGVLMLFRDVSVQVTPGDTPAQVKNMYRFARAAKKQQKEDERLYEKSFRKKKQKDMDEWISEAKFATSVKTGPEAVVQWMEEYTWRAMNPRVNPKSEFVRAKLEEAGYDAKNAVGDYAGDPSDTQAKADHYAHKVIGTALSALKRTGRPPSHRDFYKWAGKHKDLSPSLPAPTP
jgi:hypothetical protein